MLIKDMFKKPIDRDIKGVIVVGEGEDSNAKQELEEYVVTRELSKHFREFFDNYNKGIVGETTKTGVWISGFFGSGKSHFLKILSYLLDGQKLIGGKRAVDYFIDDHKIEDAMVLADDCADAGEPPKAKPQASAAKATRRMDAMGGWNAQAMKLVSQAHLDVTRGAHIRTNMATDALVVIGVYIPPCGGLGFRYLEHSHLRAIDHAVVTFKTLAATHAALGLCNGLRFEQGP